MDINLFLSLDGIWQAEEKKEILSTIDASNLGSRSFVTFIDCNIPKRQSFYIRNKSGKINISDFPYGMKSGPNIQFFKSLKTILSTSKYASSLLLMELDAYPLKKNWLTELNNRLNWLESFSLIAGSRPDRNSVAPSIRDHINGNAVYFIRNKLFPGFLEEWEKVLLKAVKINNDLAFDVVIPWCNTFRNFDQTISNIMRSSSINIGKLYAECTIDISNIILNLEGKGISFNSTNEYREFIELNENVVIVHGKCKVNSIDIPWHYYTNNRNKISMRY